MVGYGGVAAGRVAGFFRWVYGLLTGVRQLVVGYGGVAASRVAGFYSWVYMSCTRRGAAKRNPGGNINPPEGKAAAVGILRKQRRGDARSGAWRGMRRRGNARSGASRGIWGDYGWGRELGGLDELSESDSEGDWEDMDLVS